MPLSVSEISNFTSKIIAPEISSFFKEGKFLQSNECGLASQILSTSTMLRARIKKSFFDFNRWLIYDEARKPNKLYRKISKQNILNFLHSRNEYPVKFSLSKWLYPFIKATKCFSSMIYISTSVPLHFHPDKTFRSIITVLYKEG